METTIHSPSVYEGTRRETIPMDTTDGSISPQLSPLSPSPPLSPSSSSSLSSSATCSPFLWPDAPSIVDPSSAAGPTVLSNWIMADRLCVGGYPSAAESTKAHSYAEAMAKTRFHTYVNLMMHNELKRFRPYADLITYKSKFLQPPSQVAPEFLHFPMPDGGLPKDEDTFIAFIYELLHRLKRGERMYLHCWGGHGRTGICTSVLLGVMSPAPDRSVEDSLRLCQTLHATRAWNGGHKSPEPSQVPFVKRIVARIRELPPTYQPPTGFEVSHLNFSPYEPIDLPATANADGQPLSPGTRLRLRLARRNREQDECRAGGGEGIIVVDPFGTASTTHAMSSVPSTPLMSPARRVNSATGNGITDANSGGEPGVVGAEPPPIDSNIIPRRMMPIGDSETISSASSSSSSSSSSLPPLPPFTVVQMNMLADSLATTDSFPHTDAMALQWSVRRHKLIDEMTGVYHSYEGEYNTTNVNKDGKDSHTRSDIICVQECDHYHDFLLPTLTQLGYTGSYCKKISSDSRDGIAIFVHPSKFTLIHHESIQLGESNQVMLIMQLLPNDVNGHPVKDDRRLYIVTTHLKAKNKFEQHRLEQVHIITRYMQQFLERHHPNGNSASLLPQSSSSSASSTSCSLVDSSLPFSPSSNPPHSTFHSSEFRLPSTAAIVFAGDLNDVPTSPMFQYIATGSGTLHKDNTTTPPSTNQESNPLRICHPFWFHSLYNRHYDPQHPRNHSGELYTTVKRRDVFVQRCIDYIWYSPQQLRPVGMLNIPPSGESFPNHLPAWNYPSDHLAIGGRFKWEQR